MAIRLTESRLRQIIREEISTLSRSRRVHESLGEDMQSWGESGLTPKEVVKKMVRDRNFFGMLVRKFDNQDFSTDAPIITWIADNYGVSIDPVVDKRDMMYMGDSMWQAYLRKDYRRGGGRVSTTVASDGSTNDEPIRRSSGSTNDGSSYSGF